MAESDDILNTEIIKRGSLMPDINEVIGEAPPAPKLQSISPEVYFKNAKIDEDNYINNYFKKRTKEEIAELFPKANFDNERRLSLVNFGLNLMKPTEGGKIIPAVAFAGEKLTEDLGDIAKAKREQDQAEKQFVATELMNQEANELAQRGRILMHNKNIDQIIGEKQFEQRIKFNDNALDQYNQANKAYTSKYYDFAMEQAEPKAVTIQTKMGDGTYSEPFDAFYVPATGKYFQPVGVIDGEPQFRQITNLEGLRSNELGTSDTMAGMVGGSGRSQFIDLQTSIDTFDRNLFFLDELNDSFLEDPRRAGFIAGIKKHVQTYGNIISNAFNPFPEGYTQEDTEDAGFTDGLTYGGGKFLTIDSYLDLYLSNPDMVERDLADGSIDPETVEALKKYNKGLDAAAAGAFGNMVLELNNSYDLAPKNTKGQNIYESAEEQAKIRSFLKFDEDLPANEARATAIIYAIARARKASGRLNLDDIQRAAKSLNIYGDSQKDVLAKMKFLQRELTFARQQTINIMRSTYRKFYDSLDPDMLVYDRKRMERMLQGSGIDDDASPFGGTYSWNAETQQFEVQ